MHLYQLQIKNLNDHHIKDVHVRDLSFTITAFVELVD